MNPHARFGRRWTGGASTAVVIAVLAGPTGANAQREAPADERPAFEAATVKLAAPGAVRNLVMPPPASPNRLYIPSMTLLTLIYSAYGDGGFNTSMRVTGGPNWINRTACAVEGVASGRATSRNEQDVPSLIDLCDPRHAREWERGCVFYRPGFAFVSTSAPPPT